MPLNTLSYEELQHLISNPSANVSHQEILNEAGLRFQRNKIEDYQFLGLVILIEDCDTLIFPARLYPDTPKTRAAFFERIQTRLPYVKLGFRGHFWGQDLIPLLNILTPAFNPQAVNPLDLPDQAQLQLIQTVGHLAVYCVRRGRAEARELAEIAREFLTYSIHSTAEELLALGSLLRDRSVIPNAPILPAHHTMATLLSLGQSLPSELLNIVAMQIAGTDAINTSNINGERQNILLSLPFPPTTDLHPNPH